ncbi:hypothetical protein M5E86_07240 [Blautia wexlerae]|nr:hypothetical protein M5E86_07240 [Blautia wexlerae]
MHINKKDLIEFDNGNMNTQEIIEFLSHLDHCDFCLEQMMEQEDSNTDTAPAYLMEQILDKADSGEVQLARAANQASRRIQLLHYSLQTARRCDGCPVAFIQYPEPGFHLLASGYFLSDRQNIART